MSSPNRTYTTALHDLSLLQSNRATVSLFNTPTPTPQSTQALNALAIPEMLAALRVAGYTPASLASSLRCVHIAGTKGKGSVSALIASILAQYPSVRPVGLYTSPHLVSPRERIVISGAPISREKFTKYFYEIWDKYDDGQRPHYFRFLTILAFHSFIREGVRDAVIECGIGGEYDATNILAAEGTSAAVVTQLGVDHVRMLGETRAEIAWHKAGVWKKGVRGFTRRAEGEVGEVLRERGREKGVKELVEVGEERFGAWRGVEGAGMEGPWVRWNMVLATAAAREHLVGRGVRFEGPFGEEGWTMGDVPGEFERGLREARLRGRCETVRDGEGTEWFVDGAHTEDSLAGVGEWFVGKTKGEGEVRVVVFNQQDRDPGVLLRALLSAARENRAAVPVFTHAVFTRNEEVVPAEGEPERDLSVQNQAKATLQDIDAGTETHILNAVQPAIDLVRGIAADARKDGKACKVLVTGSFHLVGAVLKTIEDVEE